MPPSGRDPLILDPALAPAAAEAALPASLHWRMLGEALLIAAQVPGVRSIRDDLRRAGPCGEWRASGRRCPGAAACPAARRAWLPAAPFAAPTAPNCAHISTSIIGPALIAIGADRPDPAGPFHLLVPSGPAYGGIAVVTFAPIPQGTVVAAVQATLDGELVESFRLALSGLGAVPSLAVAAAPVQLVKKLHPDLDLLIAEYALVGARRDAPNAERVAAVGLAIRRAMEQLRSVVEQFSTV